MQQCPVHIGRGTLFCPTILKGTVAVKRLDTARRLRCRLGKFCDQARELLLVAKVDSLRSSALVNVLLFTGVRISEALGASTASYGHDAGHRTLSIQRKGGKTAKVAVPAPAVEALNLYLGTTGADVVPILGPVRSLPLFTTRTGRPWNRSEAFRTVQRLARKAGVDGQISLQPAPHLRHSPWTTG
jgi:site-specific recombinase XerD